jgi:hypothetical protein
MAQAIRISEALLCSGDSLFEKGCEKPQEEEEIPEENAPERKMEGIEA